MGPVCWSQDVLCEHSGPDELAFFISDRRRDLLIHVGTVEHLLRALDEGSGSQGRLEEGQAEVVLVEPLVALQSSRTC